MLFPYSEYVMQSYPDEPPFRFKILSQSELDDVLLKCRVPYTVAQPIDMFNAVFGEFGHEWEEISNLLRKQINCGIWLHVGEKLLHGIPFVLFSVPESYLIFPKEVK